MLYCLTVPTPNQHPGFVDHLLEGPDEPTFDKEFKDTDPEPSRGKAFDTAQRHKYAQWKQRYLEWLLKRPDITPVTPLHL